MATIAPLPISFNPADFSSDFLLNAVGNYNGLSATDRSQYSDDLDFEPLQVDATNFDSTMENPGFMNFITGRKAFGATIFVDESAEKRAQRRNVPSASELQKRLSGGTPMFHEGEGIPKYDPASGLTPQQFWSQYPSFLRTPGLTTKEAIYGRTPTSVEEEEIEASENVSQSYRERPPSFTPSYGRDHRPDPTLDTISFASDTESGLELFTRWARGENMDPDTLDSKYNITPAQLERSKTLSIFKGSGFDSKGNFPGADRSRPKPTAPEGFQGPAGSVNPSNPSGVSTPTGGFGKSPGHPSNRKHGGKVRSFIE